MVNPRNIQRSKSHFLSLACGVDLIIGINGFIWIGLPEDTQARLNTTNVIDGNPYALANRVPVHLNYKTRISLLMIVFYYPESVIV